MGYSIVYIYTYHSVLLTQYSTLCIKRNSFLRNVSICGKVISEVLFDQNGFFILVSELNVLNFYAGNFMDTLWQILCVNCIKAIDCTDGHVIGLMPGP